MASNPISGTSGNDRLTGTDGNDVIYGGDGNDRIDAGAGNDLIIGGAGNDSVNGGLGYDTVRFSGAQSDYDIAYEGGFWRVRDKNHRNGRDGVDRIFDVERFHFAADNSYFYIGQAPLFTSEADVVDFDEVAAGAYIEGTQYHALGGNDVVLLPSSLEELAEAGYAWTTPFHGGDGNDVITVRDDNQNVFGDEGNDRLIVANAPAWVGIDGGNGDDVIETSALAYSVLAGGAGDDTIVISGGYAALNTLQGGEGVDTMRFSDAHQAMNLRWIPVHQFTGIEAIDFGGHSGNTLLVDAAHVIAASDDTDTLFVRGSAGGRVEFRAADAWVLGGPETIAGVEYSRYTSGDATLMLQSGITTSVSLLGLDQIDGSNGFGLFSGFSGLHMSAAGDFDGDGYSDVLLNGYLNQSWLYFGHAGSHAQTLDLPSGIDGTNGFAINAGTQDWYSNRSVSGAGDVNGDGYADIIIGDVGRGVTGGGESYVVFGRPGGMGPVLDVAALDGTDGFSVTGLGVLDYAGYSVSSAGDLNGDGYSDLLIGAVGADGIAYDTGTAYVVFGGAAGTHRANISVTELDGSNGFRINGVTYAAGFAGSVSDIGDFNGDGIDDVVIGSYAASSAAEVSDGAAFVLFGTTAPRPAVIDLYDGTPGTLRISGAGSLDYAAGYVRSAGDVNGDGLDDLAISASDAGAGHAYVVFGRASGAAIDLAALDGSNGFRVNGSYLGSAAGSRISGAGDVNGDGYGDLIVGAPYANAGAHHTGEAYLLFGAASGFSATVDLSTLDGSRGYVINGGGFANTAGSGASAAGDVNGDGLDDFMIGAAGVGLNYVLFGTPGAATVLGTAGSESLVGTDGDDCVVAGGGDDTLDGVLGSDVLKGGAGNDIVVFDAADRRIEGGSGFDTLRLVGAGEALDLTLVANNRLAGIEAVDLTHAAHVLYLDLTSVLRLSDTSNAVFVNGDSGDSVSVSGAGWTAGGTLESGGVVYSAYYNGAASLLVQDGVSVAIAL